MEQGFRIASMVRENIRSLKPYASARDEYSGSASVFLDANENPYNTPLNRYPDPGQQALKQEISALKGLPVEHIFLGNGSDEGIDLLYRVCCEPGRNEVITVEPTYGMYRVCADINNVEVKAVLLREDFSLDPEVVLAAVNDKTRLIFLCSPNNPSANSLDREAVLEILQRAPCLVVVDEAYVDFSSGKGFLDLLAQQEKLVVLQTLSKAWGLAGIRLGMVFAHPTLISHLTAVKYPYNVNSLSMEKALESLDRKAEMEARVSLILEERDMLARKLAGFSFVDRVFPSDANFLLVRTASPRNIYDHLMAAGIIVRDRSAVPRCEGCLRITVGTPEENAALLAALEKYDKLPHN